MDGAHLQGATAQADDSANATNATNAKGAAPKKAASKSATGKGKGGWGASTVESTRSHVPLAAGSDAEGL